MKTVDISDPQFAYDPEDPERFRAGMFRLGTLVGSKATGTSVYEIPPGASLCPYHYEYGEEEWLLVLSGRAAVRTPEGTEEVGPQQVVFFPTGPEGAHEIRNDGGEPLRVLMWSSVVHPAVTVYPDSDKYGIWTGGDRSDDAIVPRAAKVGYFHGET
jgi:uncharacterized cupin superfamily protein